jgi:hypothetical protein
MSLLGDIAGRLLAPLVDAIKKALGPFGKLFDLISKFFTGFRDSFTKGQELANEVMSEIAAWRNFTSSVPYRTGVINIPKAVEQTKALLDQIKAAWESVVDLGRQIQKQARGQTEDPTVEAEEAVKDIESSGVKTLLEKFPKLAKGLEKLLGFLAVAIGILETIQASIDDLKNIVDAIKGIREEIEFGSTIFLQQKNRRKREHLSDGSPIVLRIGSLHS